MLFNSIEFCIFLPIVFFLYWFVTHKKLQLQNILILTASYVFYGWWNWKFLILIIFSSFIDFTIAILIDKQEKQKNRKLLLSLSLCINLGLLAFFKYYNFFVESFINSFNLNEENLSFSTLNIILPVGISFYTFQTLSYTIDVYRKKLEATKNFIAFASFVSFFPQLVAGPIERATHLLPQFLKERKFSYNQAVSGVQLIVWGLFKKIVIADNSAIIVNGIYDNFQNQSSISLIMGMVLFSFQIYCDFSGYSDIAIGLSRILGFDLMQNFKFPYFSKNIRSFWNRWHISLSTWFRDYVYFPLGGSKVSALKILRNTLIVFLISGLWHGANWTFVFWGLLHAVLFIPMIFIKEQEKNKSLLNSIKTSLQTIITFIFVTILWVFFRSDDITTAFDYLQHTFTLQPGKMFSLKTNSYLLITLNAFIGIFILTIVEYFSFKKEATEIKLSPIKLVIMIILIAVLGVFKNQSDFIYFQF